MPRYRAFIALIVLCASPLLADVVYTYTGSTFTDFAGNPGVGPGDHLSVSITMANAFTPNITQSSIEQYGSGWPCLDQSAFCPGPNTMLAISITDGLHTLSGANNFLLEVDATDSNGLILQWHLLAQSGGDFGVFPFMETEYFLGFGTDIMENSDGEAFNNFGGSRSGKVGTWSFADTTTETPEPSGLVLLGPSLLIGGVFLARIGSQRER